MRLRHIALFLLLILLAGGGVFYAALSSAYDAPGPLAAEKILYLPPGSGGKATAAKLENEGVVDSAFYFHLLARLHRIGGELKAGEYQFKAHMSIAEVIALLQSGKTYQHKLTIAEGLTSAEIAALVNAAETMTGTVDVPPEGSLLPETYSYSYGDARPALIARMKKSMSDTLQALWPARADNPFIKTPQDAVTLASIVEKETGVATERPRVAGVFLNRLKTGMPLQSDPTVIYAVTMGKEKLNRGITRSDLNTDSPYNTYVKTGLPPGPIANPGKASINAVLHPEANNYLYFVADGSGGHAFAATLDEHTRNVARWRELEKGRNSAN